MSSISQTKRYCPSCGTPTFDGDQRFCASCGALLGSTSQASEQGPGGPAAGKPGPGLGLDGVVNQYIQDRVRDSSTILAQQVKQELKMQVRRTAATQVQRHGGKLVLYAGVGVAGLIVAGAVLSLVTGLLMQLLPFALIVIAAYIGYQVLAGRLRR